MSTHAVKHRRGKVRTKSSRLVAFWVPNDLAASLDEALEDRDTDRSKFIREAIREKIQRCGTAKIPA